ncbi:DUF1904 family protein [Gemella sp. GH3]|uniref:DUF1904 family protein n=1 Tax=unclassified Gemella TaxID=2624949 RepID=UPI0015D05F41|nr:MULTISPECIES: DUF1904 family protein [unclassified Gemella]MBF0713288.1 DUF1904 family protein [Gemella sp. GH3.1]NYS50240.1 DUF1904 family protein [Gemella sp. GH3]
MPRIVVRGMEKEDLKKVDIELLDNISEIIQRPKDTFTLDLINSVAISDGKEISRVYIEISWKNRSTEVCEQVAKTINSTLSNIGYNKVYVYFKDIDLEKEFVF